MTTLLLGGTGKTATRTAALLKDANIPVLLASRRGPDAAPRGYPAIKFDWSDEATWATAFEQHSVNAVYMMEPQVAQPWVPMIKFIDFAKSKGTKRFVLCGGTTTARGQDGMGRVWDHFVSSGVEYCVLKPSWFMGVYCMLCSKFCDGSLTFDRKPY
jgi:festuclavine dehydrogenase